MVDVGAASRCLVTSLCILMILLPRDSMLGLKNTGHGVLYSPSNRAPYLTGSRTVDIYRPLLLSETRRLLMLVFPHGNDGLKILFLMEQQIAFIGLGLMAQVSFCYVTIIKLTRSGHHSEHRNTRKTIQASDTVQPYEEPRRRA